jgi:hypothetical protein
MDLPPATSANWATTRPLEGVEGYLLFLQFKRPLKYSASSPKEYPYWFKVDSRQHSTLLALASKYPEAVHYAFPMIGNHQEIIDAAPNLIAETLLVPIASAGPLDDPPPHHDVEAYPDHAKFHSEPLRVQGRSVRELSAVMAQRRVPYPTFVQLYETLRRETARMVGVAQNGDLVVEVRMPRALFVPAAP